MKKFLIAVLTTILMMSVIVQPSDIKAKALPSFSPKLKVLEIIDQGSSQISPLLLGEDFDITTITMKQFVASRGEIDGKYDIIAIPEGTYSTAGVSGTNHATQNVLNDITNLKADEIISQFINKGQPVILEKNAIQNGGKLQTRFGQYTSSNKNVIVYDKNGTRVWKRGNWVTITDKKQDLISYLSTFFNSKNYKPRPRFGLTKQPGSQIYKPGDKLEFTLNMLRPTDVTAKDLKAFLYIDSDFNDQYDSSEIVLEKSLTSATDTLSYELPRGYSGIRNWKLEVVDMGTNLKDYQKGTIRFKDQKIEVNVLQITKDANDPSSLKKQNNMNQSYLSTDEYQTNIDVTDMASFNQDSGTYSHTNINGKYNMLIFGFADVYNNTAINTNAVSSVRKFINTNQSILFTHDTIFGTNNNWVNNFKADTGQEGTYTNLGYGAPNPSTATQKINDGLITTYPYGLADNITINTTHNQYYMLNLEDPKVIPWYNIIGSSRDPYDSWNHYYTYSKGNITYSGTGHTNTKFPDEEQKLFVNTMYRAFLGSNHAPVLTVINPKEKDVIPAHQKIELSYTIQDFDLKDKKVSTKVFLNNVEVYTEANVTNGSTIVRSIDHGMPNGGNAILRIEATDSQGAKVEKTINLTIEKIEANLEISRTASTQDIVPVNGEIKLNYVVQPKKITGNAAKNLSSNEEFISNVKYSEKFPANIEVIAPSGFTRTGSLEDGYTVTSNLPSVQYTRVGNEYVANPTNFEITVIPKDKKQFTLNNSQISYTDLNKSNQTAQFNQITVRADYELEKIALPENIVINKDIPKNLYLDLKINPESAGIKDIVWSESTGGSILSIDSKTGVVIAKAEGGGSVTVKVTDVFGNVKEATTYVTVRIPVESITVSDISLKVGDTKTLPITIAPQGAMNGVTIELTDPSLASINKKNLEATGLKPGVTTIKVKGINSDGEVVESTATLTVEQILVSKITVTPNPKNIKKFEELAFSEFTVVIEPKNATNKNVKWRSLDPSIVSIDPTKQPGTIYGRNTGTATVEISTEDGTVSTTIPVNVGSPLTGISANDLTMEIGDSADANSRIQYHPSDATNIDKDKTPFSSSDENIVAVDAKGNMIARGLGTAFIDITVYDENNKTYTAKLKVNVVGISSAKEITMNKGDTSKVSKYINYYLSDSNVDFKSSDTNVVKVDQDGNITAQRLGTATIDIKVSDANGRAYSSSLKVTVVDGDARTNNGKDRY